MRKPDYEMLKKYFNSNYQLSSILNSIIEGTIVIQNPFNFKKFLNDNKLENIYSELSVIGWMYRETYEDSKNINLKFLNNIIDLKKLNDFLTYQKCDKLTFSNPKDCITVCDPRILASFIKFIKTFTEKEYGKYKGKEEDYRKYQMEFKKRYPRQASIIKEWRKSLSLFYNFLRTETYFNDDSKYSNTNIYQFILDFCLEIGIDQHYLPDTRELRKYI